MNHDAAEAEGELSARVGEGRLGLGWSYAVARRARGLCVRLAHPTQEPLQIEITMTARGPLVRAAATSLVIDAAEEISARCERFSIEARDTVELRARESVQCASGGIRSEAAAIDMQATLGDVRMRANDNVQLLGEQVLLNCEREAPVPEWEAAQESLRALVGFSEATVPREDACGDPELLARLESAQFGPR